MYLGGAVVPHRRGAKICRSWTLYILCVTGLAIFLVAAFFGNGGGALISESLPEPLRDILGPEVVPLPWPRITPDPGGAAETAIVVILVVILAINAQILLQWLIGFLWPIGIVECPPCGRKTSSNRVKRPTRGSKEERQPLLSDNTADGGVGDSAAAGKVDVEGQNKKVILSLRAVTRGTDPEFIAKICQKNILAILSYSENLRRRIRLANRKQGKEGTEEATPEKSDSGAEGQERLPGVAGENDAFGWILEVVTERKLDLSERIPANGVVPIHEILVPADYKTPNDTQCKAKNLCYANMPGVSCLEDDDFIVHLDEETVVTEAALEGIVEFVAMHPDRVGQGMTVFGRAEKIGNYLLTMFDTARFIDDYCCFRLWHTLGVALRGMKGSNFVLSVGLERFISFDLGRGCSLLEDAAFALTAAQKGVKFGHFRGLMLEQSPLTFADYFRQRRRWINGLINVCSEKSIRLKYRWLLILSLASWFCAPISLMAFLTIMCAFHIPATPTSVFARVFITAPPAYGAFWGAALSFSPATRGVFWYPLLVVGNLLVVPICTLFEAMAVAFAVFVRTEKFEVVVK